jgi:GxxExxY protein
VHDPGTAKAEPRVESERQIPFAYKGQRIKSRLRLDLVVEDSIIVELKAVERLHPVHQAQVITYLKLTGYLQVF